MRGYLADLDPVIAAVLYSFQQVREDVERWTAGLTEAQVWHQQGEVAPAGFQLRHMAGSMDRLITYALGEALTAAQLAALKTESARGDVSLAELQDLMEASIQRAEAAVRVCEPSRFGELRELGRKRIPTTLAGLLIHTAEHTQRHLGLLIAAVKVARGGG